MLWLLCHGNVLCGLLIQEKPWTTCRAALLKLWLHAPCLASSSLALPGQQVTGNRCTGILMAFCSSYQ